MDPMLRELGDALVASVPEVTGYRPMADGIDVAVPSPAVPNDVIFVVHENGVFVRQDFTFNVVLGRTVPVAVKNFRKMLAGTLPESTRPFRETLVSRGPRGRVSVAAGTSSRRPQAPPLHTKIFYRANDVPATGRTWEVYAQTGVSYAEGRGPFYFYVQAPNAIQAKRAAKHYLEDEGGEILEMQEMEPAPPPPRPAPKPRSPSKPWWVRGSEWEGSGIPSGSRYSEEEPEVTAEDFQPPRPRKK